MMQEIEVTFNLIVENGGVVKRKITSEANARDSKIEARNTERSKLFQKYGDALQLPSVKIREEAEIYGNKEEKEEPLYVETGREDGNKFFSESGVITRIKELIKGDDALDIDNYPTDDDIIDCGIRLFGVSPEEDL